MKSVLLLKQMLTCKWTYQTRFILYLLENIHLADKAIKKIADIVSLVNTQLTNEIEMPKAFAFELCNLFMKNNSIR